MSDAEATHSEISAAEEIEQLVEPLAGFDLFDLRIFRQCRYPLGGMFEPGDEVLRLRCADRFLLLRDARAVAYRGSPARRALGSPARQTKPRDCGVNFVERSGPIDCAKDGNKRSLSARSTGIAAQLTLCALQLLPHVQLAPSPSRISGLCEKPTPKL